MVDALRHENFYVTGMCVDESLGAYVGWIARKDSFSEEMPLRNERRDITTRVLRRRVPGVRDSAESEGTGTRARYHWALTISFISTKKIRSFPAGLNGRFHGLLIDRNRGTAMLFNDRYGMHRIYYHESKDAFYFAAEAKAILSRAPGMPQVGPAGLRRVCGMQLCPRESYPL